jgi:hypothetical protein
VAADQHVTEDVVVIGGDATIDGQVDGDVVVIGGTARLGPRAQVKGELTVVGGVLERDPGAIVRGEINEIGVGANALDGLRSRGLFRGMWPIFGVTPLVRLAGTLMRVVLLVLFGWIVVLMARTPVQLIADRAAAEPLKAGLVGFLIELVFIPALVVTIVMLAMSIIGIPLLALVPLVIVGFIVVLIVGFTGVAYRLGLEAERRLGRTSSEPYVATLLGIAVIVAPLLLGRLVGLAPGFGVAAVALAAVGVALEYVGWTVGLGAAVLARFGHPRPPAVTPVQTAGS